MFTAEACPHYFLRLPFNGRIKLHMTKLTGPIHHDGGPVRCNCSWLWELHYKLKLECPFASAPLRAPLANI